MRPLECAGYLASGSGRSPLYVGFVEEASVTKWDENGAKPREALETNLTLET